MARMNSRVRHGTESLLKIESGAAAKTTVGNNASSGYLDLLALTEAYWDNNELAVAEDFVIQILISACDDGNSNETYVFQVQVDAVNTFDDNPVTVFETAHTRGVTGAKEIAISRQMLLELDYESQYLRLNTVQGGTTPSLTYEAWVAPVRN